MNEYTSGLTGWKGNSLRCTEQAAQLGFGESDLLRYLPWFRFVCCLGEGRMDSGPKLGELQCLLTICTVKDIVSWNVSPSEPQCEFYKA